MVILLEILFIFFLGILNSHLNNMMSKNFVECYLMQFNNPALKKKSLLETSLNLTQKAMSNV